MKLSVFLITASVFVATALPAMANRRTVVKLPAPKVLTTVVGKPSLSGR
jgi:hypothetical protein